MRVQDAARQNLDPRTVADFGHEWSTFDQSTVDPVEIDALFEQYFRVFPWEGISAEAEGFDMGCGSGRWASRIAGRVGTLHCIDASPQALDVAKRNLRPFANCRFHAASVDATGLGEQTMDFGYSLGVLHHVPDTAAAISACVQLLKPGAPLLLYLYYAFDNRPRWYRALWRASDLGRQVVSRSPRFVKLVLTTLAATLVYWPLARLARLAETFGRDPSGWPLAYYRARSFYTMRTDAYDRFGTRLEARFTRRQITDMMMAAGLEQIAFSNTEPFWCAVGVRA